MHVELSRNLIVLVGSWVLGLLIFIFNVAIVVLLRKGDELRQIRAMLLSTRIAILGVMLLQMPLFYCATQFNSPIEQPLTAYGGQGHSWLYYFGRPGTTFLGVIFGFFSDLHSMFRYTCFFALLLGVVMDSLSEAQVAERLDCFYSGRCPQRNPWTPGLLQMYVYRDLVGLVLSVWTLLLVSYLMTFLGFYRPYYSYRQLTLGEFNRLLKLQEVYATYFEDLYDVYFGSAEGDQDLDAGLRAAVTERKRRRRESGGGGGSLGRNRPGREEKEGERGAIAAATGGGGGDLEDPAVLRGLGVYQGQEAAQLRSTLTSSSRMVAAGEAEGGGGGGSRSSLKDLKAR